MSEKSISKEVKGGEAAAEVEEKQSKSGDEEDDNKSSGSSGSSGSSESSSSEGSSDSEDSSSSGEEESSSEEEEEEEEESGEKSKEETGKKEDGEKVKEVSDKTKTQEKKVESKEESEKGKESEEKEQKEGSKSSENEEEDEEEEDSKEGSESDSGEESGSESGSESSGEEECSEKEEEKDDSGGKKEKKDEGDQGTESTKKSEVGQQEGVERVENGELEENEKGVKEDKNKRGKQDQIESNKQVPREQIANTAKSKTEIEKTTLKQKPMEKKDVKDKNSNKTSKKEESEEVSVKNSGLPPGVIVVEKVGKKPVPKKSNSKPVVKSDSKVAGPASMTIKEEKVDEEYDKVEKGQTMFINIPNLQRTISGSGGQLMISPQGSLPGVRTTTPSSIRPAVQPYRVINMGPSSSGTLARTGSTGVPTIVRLPTSPKVSASTQGRIGPVTQKSLLSPRPGMPISASQANRPFIVQLDPNKPGQQGTLPKVVIMPSVSGTTTTSSASVPVLYPRSTNSGTTPTSTIPFNILQQLPKGTKGPLTVLLPSSMISGSSSLTSSVLTTAATKGRPPLRTFKDITHNKSAASSTPQPSVTSTTNAKATSSSQTFTAPAEPKKAPVVRGKQTKETSYTPIEFGSSVHSLLPYPTSRRKSPNHRVPQPPAHLGIDYTLYKCMACGDEFAIQSSFKDHMDRKSMLIKHPCEFCVKTFTFYNMCRLTEHIKRHDKWKDRLTNHGPWNIDLAIKPLEKSFLTFAPHSDKRNKTPVSSEETDSIPDANNQAPSKGNVNNGKNTVENNGGGTSQDETVFGPIVQSDGATSVTSTSPSDDAHSQNNAGDTANDPSDGVSRIQKSSRGIGGNEREERAGNNSGSAREGSVERGNAEKRKLGSDSTDVANAKVARKDDHAIKCPECKFEFQNAKSFEAHFSTLLLKEDLCRYQCETCGMAMPTKCGLAAHVRTHSMQFGTPYVCPECGKTITGDFKVFRQHLQRKCLHESRIVQYQCPKCPRHYINSVRDLEEHVKQHRETYFKCLHCPMAFKSRPALEEHASDTHTIKKLKDSDFKNIFKCPLCDTVFHFLGQLQSHHSTVHEKSLMNFHFRCLWKNCSKMAFRAKVSLFYHMQMKHPNFNLIIQMCDRCGMEADSLEELEGHECQGAAPALVATSGEDSSSEASAARPLNCVKCGIKFNTMEEFSEHISTKHTDILIDKTGIAIKRKLGDGIERGGKKKKKKAEPIPERQVDIGGEARFPCSECDLQFFIKVALESHMEKEHGIVPQFPCHLCGATYFGKEKLAKHIKKVHEGRVEEKAFMCWLCLEKQYRKGYSKKPLLEQHLRTYHKLARNQIDWSKLPGEKEKSETNEEDKDEGPEEEGDEEEDEPAKRLRVGDEDKFTCAKCNFVCEERVEFLEHITRHKNDKESEQCTECGMCFVVKPSLKRHLFMVHKIRNFVKYFAARKLYLESKTEKGGAEKHVSQNQAREKEMKKTNGEETESLVCDVCSRSFKGDSALRTHMRSHGMAFIRSKQVSAWEGW